jgi:serine/threonine protein kinase
MLHSAAAQHGVTAGGSLQASLDARRSCGSRTTWLKECPRWAQLVSAIAFLASKSIVHGDVKPSNVLVRSDNTLMLSDFGSSGKVGDKRLPHKCYTYPYRPHECLISARTSYIDITCSMDVWAMGCVLYDMTAHTLDDTRALTTFMVGPDGYSPGYNLKRLREVVASRCHRRCDDGSAVSEHVLRCLVQPSERPDAGELLIHLLFVRGLDYIENCELT